MIIPKIEEETEVTGCSNTPCGDCSAGRTCCLNRLPEQMASEVRCIHGMLRAQCADCRAMKARKATAKRAAPRTKRPTSPQKLTGANGRSPAASLKPLRDRLRSLGQEMERLGRERNAAKRAGNLAKAAALGPQVERAKERFRAAQKEHQQAKGSSAVGNDGRSGAKKRGSSAAGPDAARLPPWSAGIRLVQDPDASTHQVWITKFGRSFHNRDCQVIAAKDNAVRVRIGVARSRGLERCMHCAQTVR